MKIDTEVRSDSIRAVQVPRRSSRRRATPSAQAPTAPGDAASVAVSLKRDGDALLLEVKDDGRGFDYEAASHGPSFGLLGIRERVRVLGGTLTIDSGAGRGTTVSIHIPHISERQT